MIELVFACVLLIAAGGTGQFILRKLGFAFNHRLERLCFSFAVGWGMLILLVLALGLAHLLYEWTLYVVVIAWAVVGSREVPYIFSRLKYHLGSLRPEPRSVHFWLVLLTVLGSALLLLQAMAPPHGATDPLAYQLALPKIYLLNHHLSFEPTITGALYPSNMGLLYVVGIGLRNGILAQILHWLMGALTLLALVGFGQRYYSTRVGVWAAALFSLTPVFAIFSPQGYVDVGLCFFQFMAFWAVFNWCAQREMRALVLAAALTGLAMGVKHQGMATLFLGGLIVLGEGIARKRGAGATLSSAVVFGVVALLLVAPWYARAYAMAGNPIWPLANDFFGGQSFKLTPVVVANSSGDPQESGMGKLMLSISWLRETWHAMSPWDWTFYPQGAQKAIGVYFVALLPGALVFLRDRKGYLLLGFCFVYYLVLVRVLHMNPRYGMVLFAFASIPCGYVCQRLYASRSKAVAALFTAAFFATFLLNVTWAYAMAKPVARVSLGLEARESFVQREVDNYRIFDHANKTLPAESKLLLQGIVSGYYCDLPYLWDHPYQATINYQDYQTSEQLLERMRELGITHIARMIYIPPFRQGYFPQYFEDPYHEEFRKKYLRLIYRDEAYALFEVVYR